VDTHAAFEAHLGGTPETATEEGIRAASKAQSRRDRQAEGFGQRRGDWHRKAIPAYTWLRTDKGPQVSWLHPIGQAQDESCPWSRADTT